MKYRRSEMPNKKLKNLEQDLTSISVVVCSRDRALNKVLISNIEDTIGVDHEVIIINNSDNKLSIFQAYNRGIEQSQKEIICFLHEDVVLHTQNWGIILKNIFDCVPLTGLIGIAGGRIKCAMPSSWWDAGKNAVHITQHFTHKQKELRKSGFNDTYITEVAAIDGVFMVMQRDENIRFDESLKGFHNYDLYLSLRYHLLNKKVVVTDKILIEHFSHGSLNKAWYESTSHFHKLYGKNFPIVKGDFSKSTVKEKELIVGYRFITGLVKKKLYKDAFYWWFRIFKLDPFSKYHLKFLVNLVS